MGEYGTKLRRLADKLEVNEEDLLEHYGYEGLSDVDGKIDDLEAELQDLIDEMENDKEEKEEEDE